MSYFLCSDETFASIAYTLKIVLAGGRPIKHTVCHSLRDYGLGNPAEVKKMSTKNIDERVDRFVIEIQLLNQIAVGEDVDTNNDSILKKGGHLRDIELFKSLQCVLYQLDSSGADLNSYSYRALKTMVNEIAITLVMEMPGYSEAKWG